MIWSFPERAGSALRVLAAVCCLLPASLCGHVPVPASVLDPKTPAEAWNVIRLSTANVERLLHENRLAEIPDQISLCSPALRALPRWTADQPEQRQPVAEGAVSASINVASLAQAAVAGDRRMAENTFGALRATLEKLAANYDPGVTQADIFFCPMHPDFVSTDPSAHCAKCGMNLLARRIPYSFVYVPPGEPSLQLTARTDGGPTAGRPSKVTVHLSHRDGKPVVLGELMVMHTQPIHLLIIDPALEDYHHEHPLPSEIPGDYTFSFTPAKSASYRIFADLVPLDTGTQEYPFTDLSIDGSPVAPLPVHGPSSLVSTVEGLTFRLTLNGDDGTPPRAGQVHAMQVTVSGADGNPIASLEPVMNAFAHLVGFYDDYRTVVHLHPEGGEVVDPNARGGPAMSFKFYPPKPGFLRLFCQVQVGGRMVFAPFGLNVSP